MRWMKNNKKILLILSSFLLFLIIASYFLSTLTSDAVRSWVKNKVDSRINFSDLNLNLLQLELEVNNFDFNSEISAQKIRIDFAFSNFLRKKIKISEIIIINSSVNADLKNNNLFIADLSDKKNEPDRKDFTNKKEQKNWQVIIEKITILNSKIALNSDINFTIENSEINNISWPNNYQNNLKLKGNISLSNSNILVKANQISDSAFEVNFDFDRFDLSLINKIKAKQKLGKVTGFISGNIKLLLGQEDKYIFNVTGKELLVFSKDLNLINYAASLLKIDNLVILNKINEVVVSSNDISLKNLLFSVPESKFLQKKKVENSKVKIAKIDASFSKNNISKKGIIKFKNGGFIAGNNYAAANKKILDINIKNVDLSQFSNSFESLLKYHIASGLLSVDSKIITKNNQINGDVNVKLSQISLDNKNEFGDKIQSKSYLPLATILSTIQNDNGVVDLTFNVEGSADDPDFNISKILAKGLGSMLISKITSLAVNKAALQFAPILTASIPIAPNNALYAINSLYKIATKVRFKNIKFLPLTSKITKTSQEDLQNIINFLQSRKNLKILICPNASTKEFDKNISENKILSLAKERIKSLKNYFKNKSKLDISNQIIFCRPTLNNSDNNLSQADISI